MITILISSLVLFVMWVALADIAKFTGDAYPPYVQAPAHLYTAIFVVVDVVYNLTIGSVVFLQLPRDWTLSGRLRRILSDSEELSWRWKLAYWACRKAVSPWDYNHCGIGLGK